MPKWFESAANRLEYFISAFADNIEVPLNFNHELNVSLDVHQSDLTMTMHLNQERFIVPNALRYFKQLEDVKYDTILYYGIEYGVTSNCVLFPIPMSTLDYQYEIVSFNCSYVFVDQGSIEYV